VLQPYVPLVDRTVPLRVRRCKFTDTKMQGRRALQRSAPQKKAADDSHTLLPRTAPQDAIAPTAHYILEREPQSLAHADPGHLQYAAVCDGLDQERQHESEHAGAAVEALCVIDKPKLGIWGDRQALGARHALGQVCSSADLNSAGQ